MKKKANVIARMVAVSCRSGLIDRFVPDVIFAEWSDQLGSEVRVVWWTGLCLIEILFSN